MRQPGSGNTGSSAGHVPAPGPLTSAPCAPWGPHAYPILADVSLTSRDVAFVRDNRPMPQYRPVTNPSCRCTCAHPTEPNGHSALLPTHNRMASVVACRCICFRGLFRAPSTIAAAAPGGVYRAPGQDPENSAPRCQHILCICRLACAPRSPSPPPAPAA